MNTRHVCSSMNIQCWLQHASMELANHIKCPPTHSPNAQNLLERLQQNQNKNSMISRNGNRTQGNRTEKEVLPMQKQVFPSENQGLLNGAAESWLS